MPEYRELMTFIPERRAFLPALLQRYRHLLARLGLLTEELSEWLASVDWEPDEDRFGFAAPPVELKRASLTLQVRPTILCDPAAGLEDGVWYQPGLLFEREALFDPTMYPGLEFRPAPAGIIWQALLAFAQTFPTEVIYLLADPLDLDVLRILERQEGNRWLFDLALIPSSFLPSFGPIPSHYLQHEIAEGVAVARIEMWPVLPWHTQIQP